MEPVAGAFVSGPVIVPLVPAPVFPTVGTAGLALPAIGVMTGGVEIETLGAGVDDVPAPSSEQPSAAASASPSVSAATALDTCSPGPTPHWFK